MKEASPPESLAAVELAAVSHSPPPCVSSYDSAQQRVTNVDADEQTSANAPPASQDVASGHKGSHHPQAYFTGAATLPPPPAAVGHHGSSTATSTTTHHRRHHHRTLADEHAISDAKEGLSDVVMSAAAASTEGGDNHKDKSAVSRRSNNDGDEDASSLPSSLASANAHGRAGQQHRPRKAIDSLSNATLGVPIAIEVADTSPSAPAPEQPPMSPWCTTTCIRCDSFSTRSPADENAASCSAIPSFAVPAAVTAHTLVHAGSTSNTGSSGTTLTCHDDPYIVRIPIDEIDYDGNSSNGSDILTPMPLSLSTAALPEQTTTAFSTVSRSLSRLLRNKSMSSDASSTTSSAATPSSTTVPASNASACCRFCLEPVSEQEQVTSPACGCAGTSQFVHEECLINWEVLKNNPQSSFMRENIINSFNNYDGIDESSAAAFFAAHNQTTTSAALHDTTTQNRYNFTFLRCEICQQRVNARPQVYSEIYRQLRMSINNLSNADDATRMIGGDAPLTTRNDDTGWVSRMTSPQGRRCFMTFSNFLLIAFTWYTIGWFSFYIIWNFVTYIILIVQRAHESKIHEKMGLAITSLASFVMLGWLGLGIAFILVRVLPEWGHRISHVYMNLRNFVRQ